MDHELIVKLDLCDDFLCTDAYESCVFRGSLLFHKRGGQREQMDHLVYKSDIAQPNLFKKMKRIRQAHIRPDPLLLWQCDDFVHKNNRRSLSLVREIDAYVNLNRQHQGLVPKVIGVDICSKTHRVRGIILQDAGVDLKSLIKHPDVQPGPDMCLKIAKDMLMKLKLLHDCQFVHRDVKLNNCVRPDDIQWIDFGLCKRLANASVPSDEWAYVGTPGHVPPELILCISHIDWQKCDIWSTCAALAAMMAGRTRLFSTEDYRTIIDYALMFGNRQFDLLNLDWLQPYSKLRLWFNPAMVKHNAMLDATAMILNMDHTQKQELHNLYHKAHVDAELVMRRKDNDHTRLIRDMALGTDTVTAYHRIMMLNGDMPDDNYVKSRLKMADHTVSCLTDPCQSKVSRFWELMVWTHTFERHDPKSSCSEDARNLRQRLKDRFDMIDLDNLEYGDLDMMHHSDARLWIKQWWQDHFDCKDKQPLTNPYCQQLVHFSTAMRAGMVMNPDQRPSITNLLSKIDPNFTASSLSAGLFANDTMDREYQPIASCPPMSMEIMQYVILRFWCALTEMNEESEKSATIHIETYQPWIHHGIYMYTQWASRKHRWLNRDLFDVESWEMFIQGGYDPCVDAHLSNHYLMLLACLYLSSTMYLDSHRDVNLDLQSLFCRHVLINSVTTLIDHPLCPNMQLDITQLIDLYEQEFEFQHTGSESDSSTLSMTDQDSSSINAQLNHRAKDPMVMEALNDALDETDLEVLQDDALTDDQSQTIVLKKTFGIASSKDDYADPDDDDDFGNVDDDDDANRINLQDVIHHMIYTLIHDTHLIIDAPVLHVMQPFIQQGDFAKFINMNTSKLLYLSKPVNVKLLFAANWHAYHRLHPDDQQHIHLDKSWFGNIDMGMVDNLIQSLQLDSEQSYPS